MTQMQTDQRFPTKQFVVADPRTFDGDPYEVAERAVRQLAAVLSVADALFDPTDKMARNAEMERAFANGGEPQGSEWPNTALGRRFGQVHDQIKEAQGTLQALAAASGYNPKSPPKA